MIPSAHYDDGFCRMFVGNATDVLSELPEKSVHCCVTSPPYFGLRAYLPSDHPDKVREGGTQETPEQYVQWLVEVFRGVWRVLRDDGTLWLNLGDSYAGSWGNQGRKEKRGTQRPINGPMLQNLKPYPEKASNTGSWVNEHPVYKSKDLLMIPARVALALQADGWWLRQEIVWAKDSCMPESVRDRCTRSHEMLYMLTKRPTYFYDKEAIAEPVAASSVSRLAQDIDSQEGSHRANGGAKTNGAMKAVGNMGTRNARSVWRINPKPFSGAHYAVFAPELPLRCIKAGTSEHGVCSECGAPWRRVVERPERLRVERSDRDGAANSAMAPDRKVGQKYQDWLDANPSRTIGVEPTCSHEADTIPATVLDPFSGSGTTGLVARKLGRRSVLIDLDDRNVKLLEERMGYQGVLC